MKRRFITFYSRHPILSLHLCAFLLWLFINILGAFILHLFGKNKLDYSFGEVFILAYISVFTSILGLKARNIYIENRKSWKKPFWLLYFIFLSLIFCVLCIAMINKLSSY